MDLTLRVARPLPRHFSVRTRLSWVRHRAAGQKEGYGLDFLPEDRVGRERLIAFASGTPLSQPLRAEERVQVVLEVVGGHAQRKRSGRSVWPICPPVARSSGPRHPCAPGADVDLKLRPPRLLTRLQLKARVAWARREGDAPGDGA